MTKQDIFAFINKNQSCTLATVDGNKPHVRGMMLYRADEKGMLFHTGINKELCKQIKNNPDVEICFINDMTQVRISGVATEEKDLKLKEEIVSKRTYLKPMIDSHGWDALVVFRVRKMVATVWSMATNLVPKEYVELM
jgi:pyridoxamine 5'-phosphate oxidase